MSERLIVIRPSAKLVTEEEIAALRARQFKTATAMGEKWILHRVHSPKSKKDIPAP